MASGDPDQPGPAWPKVTAAVVAAVAVAGIGFALLRDDSQRVRSEDLPISTPTTRATTQTTTPPPTAAPQTGAQGTGGQGTGGTGVTGTNAPPSPRLSESTGVSLDGFGPVDIGMTLEQASAAAGTPIRIDPRTDLGRGCAFARAQGGPEGVAFMVVNGRIERVDVQAGRVRTVSGIGLGSTEGEVKRTYGARIRVEGHPYRPDGHYLVYTPVDPALTHLSMIFETDGQRVTSFRAGLAGAVSAIEGCA